MEDLTVLDAPFSTDSRSIDLLVSKTKSILFYGRNGMLHAQGECKEMEAQSLSLRSSSSAIAVILR